MKNIIINILKITIPLLLGVYVGWYFWDQFSESERNQFYGIFNRADYFILALSLLVGFLSHLARAKRWLYALKPMGYQPSLWRSYHAIMVGYIMNIIFPRLGEASRAGVLLKTDSIPFQKSFGSIVSERILDINLSPSSLRMFDLSREKKATSEPDVRADKIRNIMIKENLTITEF